MTEVKRRIGRTDGKAQIVDNGFRSSTDRRTK